MAIWKGTAAVSQIIGKLGNVDYMRWKNKNVVRQSPASVLNPNSDAQVVMRDALGQASIDWFKVLVQAQRDAWEAFAKSRNYYQKVPSGIRRLPQGSEQKYPGKDAFVQTYCLCVSAGVVPPWDPPFSKSPRGIITDLQAAWDDFLEFFEVTWTSPADATYDDKLRLWIDSEQEFFHKQIVALIEPPFASVPVGYVNGALGNPIAISTYRDSWVLFQADIVSSDGIKSGGSNTIRRYIGL